MAEPGAWLAVLLGVPGGLLAAIGVYRLADHVFPVPPELLETFGQSLFPETVSMCGTYCTMRRA